MDAVYRFCLENLLNVYFWKIIIFFCPDVSVVHVLFLLFCTMIAHGEHGPMEMDYLYSDVMIVCCDIILVQFLYLKWLLMCLGLDYPGRDNMVLEL